MCFAPKIRGNILYLSRSRRSCVEKQSDDKGADSVDSGFRTLLSAIYIALGAAIFFFWVPVLNTLLPFAAAILLTIAQIKRSRVKSTWIASHYSWCMRTFIWYLLWAVVLAAMFLGGVLGMVGSADHLNVDQSMAMMGLGGGILITTATIISIWYAYRVVKGVLRYRIGLAIG